MDETALDDLLYPVRTEVRVRLLDRLVAEGPVERDRLREGGVARETLRPTLAAFETRGWATGDQLAGDGARRPRRPDGRDLPRRDCGGERGSSGCWAPATRGALAWDGAVPRRRGRPCLAGRPVATGARALAPLRASADVDLLAGAVTVDALAASTDGVDDGQRFRAVFDAPSVAAIRENGELVAAVEELREAGDVQLWVVEAELGYSAGLADGTVAFGLPEDRGAPAAYLGTDDEQVHEWFARQFDELVDAAEPLTLDEG